MALRMIASVVKRHSRHRLTALSIALMGIVLIVGALSFWRYAGWLRIDEAWVQVPSSGMQELHTTRRLWWIIQGRFEAGTTNTINAVIPARSPEESPTQHEAYWMWQPADPIRVRSWDDRWHITSWNEWRLGGFGWYHTTGGGTTSRVFSLPLWLVFVIVGMPCWFALVRSSRTARRRRRGLCVNCGYNRRGIAVDSKCPECGTQVHIG